MARMMIVINFLLLMVGVAQAIVAESQSVRILGIVLAIIAGAAMVYFLRRAKPRDHQ